MNSNSTSDSQIKNISDMYNKGVSDYDSLTEKSMYEGEKLLKTVYEKYGISNGVILDIGCGTGKIKELLGDSFEYIGIDIAEGMLDFAKRRGYSVHLGAAQDVIREIPDKSVDHVIALSSLYFIKDFEFLVKEFERVARKSIFVLLEQFSPEVVSKMKDRKINLYNHNSSLIENPTELIKDVFLWKQVSTNEEMRGDVVFKIFS